jgi:CRISPR/Cas system CSM-associated protein Csm3 (group 7 of RAMP superfamily)
MARKISSRVKVTGQLLAETALHVGGIGGDGSVDMALAKNGSGQFYIPGTSLAGVLRSWMNSFDKSICEQLWGPQRQRRDTEDGFASFVLVEDAPIEGKVIAEIRDGVGIDRNWGTAAEQFKYDRAILPQGTRLPLAVTLELAEGKNWEDIQPAWQDLFIALEAGELRIGAGKTRGLGRVKLQALKIIKQDLVTRKGMLAALRDGGEKLGHEELLTTVGTKTRSRLQVSINWSPDGAFMVKSGREGIAVDMLPLVSTTATGVRFCLPGSAIKGALRSHADRIVCTAARLAEIKEQNPQKRFLEQMRRPLVQEVFGSAADAGRSGSLSVDDCYSKQAMTSEAWSAIETATTSESLYEAFQNAGLNDCQQSFHVAIDRWTGGAADSFLFSVLEPLSIAWQPLRLDLNLEHLEASLRKPALALLLFVLRDLGAGRIPLGYGANRGMGAIRVNSVDIKGRGLEEALAPLISVSLGAGDFMKLDPLLLNDLNQSWQDWISQQEVQ